MAFQIALNWLNALTSLPCFNVFEEIPIFLYDFLAISSYIVVFAFTYVLENVALLYGDSDKISQC
jgi:hypothetical protein